MPACRGPVTVTTGYCRATRRRVGARSRWTNIVRRRAAGVSPRTGLGRDVESACRIYRPRYPRKTARAAELAAFLVDEVVEDVGHAQWVFTIPKMLRVYFLHHRELLGEPVAGGGADGESSSWRRRPGRRRGSDPEWIVVQTFGDRANFHPHVHALATRGGWTARGEWIAVPYVDERAAEALFCHKVLGLLGRRGLVSRGAHRAAAVVAAQRLLRAQPASRTPATAASSRPWCAT